ncbi:hypothetical protein IWW50_007047, partial [Coemansia erecta]
MYKRTISTLVLAATFINAAPVQNQHVRKIDVDDMLNQMSSVYNNPLFADKYISFVFSLASQMLPAGSNPSTDDLYSELASYKENIGPSLLAAEFQSIEKALENINVNGPAASQLSEVVSMFHDSSVVSRMAGLVSQFINKIVEDHEEAQGGKPTGSTEDEDTKSDEAGDISEDGDDKDTKSEKEDDKDTNSDKEETTSGAASTKA